MDAHPDTDLLAPGPLMSSQGELHLNKRSRAGARRTEDGEEAVSLRVDFLPLVGHELSADQAVVIREHLRVGVMAETSK
jgi:hypothetical protein